MTDIAGRAVMRAPRTLFAKSTVSAGDRPIPEETPIAFTYDRSTYVVMMASPADLEDFAAGFSLTEGIIESPAEIASLEVVDIGKGIELRMELRDARDAELRSRRRRIAGPAGCGLCGLESLEAATAPPRRVEADLRVKAGTIFEAMSALRGHQQMNAETHAVHAAGFWSVADRRIVAAREDVGRHNALDKLAGALARSNTDPASGFVVMTSRVSIELVQKSAMIGTPLLVAVSVPTALALREADAANLTIAAVARDDSFEVFTHPERIAP